MRYAPFLNNKKNHCTRNVMHVELVFKLLDSQHVPSAAEPFQISAELQEQQLAARVCVSKNDGFHCHHVRHANKSSL